MKRLALAIALLLVASAADARPRYRLSESGARCWYTAAKKISREAACKTKHRGAATAGLYAKDLGKQSPGGALAASRHKLKPGAGAKAKVSLHRLAAKTRGRTAGSIPATGATPEPYTAEADEQALLESSIWPPRPALDTFDERFMGEKQ